MEKLAVATTQAAGSQGMTIACLSEGQLKVVLVMDGVERLREADGRAVELDEGGELPG